jgi:molybdate transport system regulatory protein
LKEAAMKTGARNQIFGEVVELKRGSLMSLVKVRIPAEAILSSVMTIESLEEMDLQAGDKVQVVVKAVNMLLIKE